MVKSIYCVKDVKSGFISPTAGINDEVAIRQFKSLTRDKNTEIGMFPEDYELWKLGEFDTDTGIIVPQLKFIYNAIREKGGE